MWPAPLRRCAAPGLCRSSSARARRCAVAPLRRCAVAPCLVHYATLTCACAVAPLRRAAVLDLLRCQGAHMRRCAVAPLRRCLVLGLRCNWSRRLRSAAMQLRPVQRSNGATEQRSNGAELRCCGTDALARSNGARSSGAELRRCGTEHRHGGSEQSNGARSNGGELRRCGQSARSTEHGAEHRSTERSNLEDACSTRNVALRL